MLRSNQFKRGAVVVLILLLLSAWGIRVGHVFIADHHHEPSHRCELALQHDSSETHFHDETYSDEDCGVCLYVFSSFEANTTIEWPDFFVDSPFSVRFSTYSSTFISLQRGLHRLRGPPATT